MPELPRPIVLGVNLTARTQIDAIRQLFDSRSADFVEILIDNFLTCDPATIRESLGSIPIAFHIMNSRFLERELSSLRASAARLRCLIDEVKPIYVSDHLARFTANGLPLPILAEVNYSRREEAVERILLWQELLGNQILLENFPSMLDQGRQQPEFFEYIFDKTGCGVLFDISNALLASKNAQVHLAQWNIILQAASHFHVGGFLCLEESDVWIDSHDRVLAEETKHWIAQTLSHTKTTEKLTLTVEFDHQIDYQRWAADLNEVRARFSKGAGTRAEPRTGG